MTIERGGRSAGVDVHLEPHECDLFIQLARDASKATVGDSASNYFSICVKLGQHLIALEITSPDCPRP